jgi:hypothetical protein
MTDAEAGKSPDEATLITSAAQGFLRALDFNIAGRTIPFRTVTSYRVSYIPAYRSSLTNASSPSLEINSSGEIGTIDAIFYARKVAGKTGQIEAVRTILLPGPSGAGESEIGIERVLSYNETLVLNAVAMRPSATIWIQDGKEVREVGVSELMKLSPNEQRALLERKAELRALREEMEKEDREAIMAAHGGKVLGSAQVVRPASR